MRVISFTLERCRHTMLHAIAWLTLVQYHLKKSIHAYTNEPGNLLVANSLAYACLHTLLCYFTNHHAWIKVLCATYALKGSSAQ